MDRDRRLTGYLRGQTDNPTAPAGFELNNPWRVRFPPNFPTLPNAMFASYWLLIDRRRGGSSRLTSIANIKLYILKYWWMAPQLLISCETYTLSEMLVFELQSPPLATLKVVSTWRYTSWRAVECSTASPERSCYRGVLLPISTCRNRTSPRTSIKDAFRSTEYTRLFNVKSMRWQYHSSCFCLSLCDWDDIETIPK